MCQCPYSGCPHFYGSLKKLHSNKSGVNALTRAVPISTVDSRKPHKQGAQFRNNSCNCQTIHFCPYFDLIFSFTRYFCSFSPKWSVLRHFHYTRFLPPAQGIFFILKYLFSISFFGSYLPAAQKAPFRMPLCYFPFTLYRLFHFDIYTSGIVYISSFSQLSFLFSAVSLLIS